MAPDDNTVFQPPDVNGPVGPTTPDESTKAPLSDQPGVGGQAPEQPFIIGSPGQPGGEALSPMEVLTPANGPGAVNNPGGVITLSDVQKSFEAVSNNVQNAQQLLAQRTPQGDPYANLLRKSQQSVLQEKLDNFNSNVQSAYNAMGMNYQVPPPPPEGQNPAERFIGLLTSSQNQLNQAQAQMAAVSARNESPALSMQDMLKVQIKMNTANQQINLFANLLSKGIDGIKTIMNIQL